MNKNTKHQAPNTREAPKLKLQTPANVADSMFGIWSLEFLWSLVFGFWCFALFPIVNRKS
jgi:hypothetical protein